MLIQQSIRFKITIVLLFAIFLLNSRSFCSTSNIVENGTAKAIIIIPENTDTQTQQAAQLLQDSIKKVSGVELAITDNPSHPNPTMIKIHIGNTVYTLSKLNGISLDVDGYIINSESTDAIVVSGKTTQGTYYGVCDFIERYVGIKWLFPGDLGEYIPQKSTISVKNQQIVKNPKFLFRTLSGINTTAGKAWLKKLKGQERDTTYKRIEFHHNLANTFNPDEFATSNPEIYPIINGARFIPNTNSSNWKNGWQPCFSEENTAILAANKILGKFNNDAKLNSYSLGVNDLWGYCQCSVCANAVSDGNYSQLYYNFCNKVLEITTKTYPNHYIGVLAYHGVKEPPVNLTLNSRLVPFLCFERLQWIDSNIAAASKEKHQKWKSASNGALGWYDYIYGNKYKMPRFIPHLMKDYLLYGYLENVRYYYGEAYPDNLWHEGPKLYITYKLLWNPFLNVDKLLTDWCKAAVGANAAPYLQDYYTFLEHYWTVRVPKSAWFNKYKGAEYLTFTELGYLDMLTDDDFNQCQALLQTVISQAGTTRQKERAQYIYDSYIDWSTNDAIFFRSKITDIENRILTLVNDGKLQNNEVFIMEAEEVYIAKPWELKTYDDTSASAGKYIAGKSVNYTSANINNPRASFSFNVEVPGKYMIFARTISSTANNNSFFVGMDNISYPIWDVQVSANWAWSYIITRSTNSEPCLYNLGTGTHSIRFQQRELGSKLDKIIIVNYDKLKANL